MPKSDMIAVTNGEHTIEVTEKAYDAFYREQGYAPVGGEKAKAPTVAEMKTKLAEAGIDVPNGAKKDEVAALFATLPTDPEE